MALGCMASGVAVWLDCICAVRGCHARCAHNAHCTHMLRLVRGSAYAPHPNPEPRTPNPPRLRGKLRMGGNARALGGWDFMRLLM
jgi:hypothetical protein